MLKLYIGLSFLLVSVLLDKNDFFNFQQHDYVLIPERFELVRYNKQYVRYSKWTTFIYNRTARANNMTLVLNIDMGNDIEVVVQGYKFASNEYRLFPLRFEVNLCTAFAKNEMGTANMMKCGNFSGCPFKKNVRYYFCNWRVVTSKFPPFIPNGKYMVEFQLLYHENELELIRGYAEVTRPIPWE